MLQPGDAFPARLAAALEAKGHAAEVINAGVSGDTTTAGLERLDWALPEGIDAVILELGANDALRGIDPAIVRANLERIIVALKGKGIPVLLAGMKAPRNWGEDYATKFDAIYPELAEKHGLLLYPFFLEGVAMDAALNLGDGMHPNPRGVEKVVAGILPKVEELVARVNERRLAAGRD
jgi:acyl-CoA thioesterase-1